MDFTELVAPQLRRREFTVSEISQTGDTTTLTLSPEGGPCGGGRGNSPSSARRGGTAEPHPFTIASAPRLTAP